MDNILILLEEIKKLLQLNKSMLNAEELCLLLGISKPYLYKLTSTGKIKFYRPFGKLIFFNKDEVLENLKQNPIKSLDEIENSALDYLLTSKKK